MVNLEFFFLSASSFSDVNGSSMKDDDDEYLEDEIRAALCALSTSPGKEYFS